MSGRWTEYGDDLFTVTDRRGADYLLAPTHEEMFTLLVQDMTSSYRDFPLVLFQVQSKFRDEARPRAGLLRGREFLMKDAYSFDLTDDGLITAYAAMRAAYQRIFARLGLEHTIVAAMSGAMGGSASEEFLAAVRRRRGHLRRLHELRLRGEHRGGDAPPCRRSPTSGTAR